MTTNSMPNLIASEPSIVTKLLKVDAPLGCFPANPIIVKSDLNHMQDSWIVAADKREVRTYSRYHSELFTYPSNAV